MKVNINSYCTVKLRQSGADRLNQIKQDLKERFPNASYLQNPQVYSEGDEFKCQIWDMIHTFGDLIGLGQIPPFETEIEVSDGRS